MKRKLLVLGAVLTLVFMCACTKENASSVDAGLKQEPIESVDNKAEATNVSVEAETETTDTDTDYMALYEGFLSGDVKVTFDKDADHGSYFETKNLFTPGTEYSLDEIKDALLKSVESNWGGVKATIQDVTNDYIDCGMDSVQELLVNVNVVLGEAEQFNIHMVIKEVEGALHVTYNCESYTRSSTEILPTGYVKNAGSSGAASGAGELGYLNKDAQYIQWYNYSFDMGVVSSDYYLPAENDSVVLDLSSIENIENLCIESYYFDNGDWKEYFYTYYYFDKDFAPIEDASIYDSENPIRKIFADNNLSVYPKSQIQGVLDQRQSEIGLSDLVLQK